MKYLFGIFIALVLIIDPAKATNERANFYDGNKLYEECSADQDVNATKDGYCIGYISGVADLARWAGFQICIPKTVSRRQIRDVTYKYIQDNPGDRHLNAEFLVFTALETEFPCDY